MCINTGEWRVAAAVGAGTRTNPLRGGKDQTLLIIGDIAWYSDTFYLDNLELGYQWRTDNPDFFVDTFIAIDREARPFFSYDGFDVSPVDLLTANNMVAQPVLGPEKIITLDQIADRKNGRHLGIRFHFGAPGEEWQLSAERDVGNIHQGVRIRLAYRFGTRLENWLIGMTPQLVWNDADFNDYYFGIDQRDIDDERLWFRAGSGFRPGLNLTASRPLSPNWGILVFARYQSLPTSVADSPLLKGNDILTAFAGLTYQF